MADDTDLLDGPEINDSLAIRPNAGVPTPTPPDVAPPAAASPAMPIAPPVQPNMKTAILGSVGARPDPNAPQYQPVKPSMGKQILGALSAGALGFKNPALGVQVGHELSQAPIVAAQQKYGTDVNDYNARFNEALQTNNAEQEDTLRRSQENKNNAEADKANRPEQPKPENLQQGYSAAITDALARGADPTTDPHVMAWKAAVDASIKPSEAEKPLGDTATQVNAGLQDRFQVLHPGQPLPAEYQLTPKSTQKDYDRVEKLLSGSESAEGTKAQRDQTNQDRAQARQDRQEAKQKPTADEQKRADMAENLNENLDDLEDIAKRRPELFGPLAGRWTELKGKFGSDDPDIAKLQVIEHQVGMVQQSTHGMRSSQGVQASADSILNHLHSKSPALLAAIGEARKSAKTFSEDVENPETKPHAGGTSAGSKGGKTSASDLGDAGGKPEGATGTLPDGTKVKVVKGRIVKQ